MTCEVMDLPPPLLIVSDWIMLLYAGGWVAPGALGVAWVLAQAVAVAVLGDLQWVAVRRDRPTGTA